MGKVRNTVQRFGPLVLGAWVLAACLGCSAMGGTYGTVAAEAKWVARRGGVVVDAHQQRAQAALDRLCADRLPVGQLCVSVLATIRTVACTWPDRHIFLARGLMDRLTDDELAAALAHEIGHLLDDGHLHSMVALRGAGDSPDHEVQADTLGCGLLRAAGVPPRAMIRVLEKARESYADQPAVYAAIGQRIQRLHALLGP